MTLCLKAWGLLSKEAFPPDALRCLDNLDVVLCGAKGAWNTAAPLSLRLTNGK